MKFKVSIFMWLWLLVGCGSGPLLSDVEVGRTELDLAQGQESLITYQVGAPAMISVVVRDAQGQEFLLRDKVERAASAEPYQLLFDGSAEIDAQTRRVLPDGEYTLLFRAEPVSGSAAPVVEERTLIIRNAPVEPFDVYDLAVTPNPFSPDEDALNDVTNFTYRLPVSATVTLDIVDPENGDRYPVISEQRGPGEHSETWSGRPVVGGFLPTGTYTYELVADDGRGNRVLKRGDVEIVSAGIGKISVLEATIEPTQIELGDQVTVTIRVQNTGPVGLRTHGPPSGYVYSSNQTYASIEDETYANKGGGLWRVGLDWQGNSGAGSRYPFRWAISPRPPAEWVEPFEFDVLQPGEEATIIGSVIVKQPEDRMTFYVGVAHEGVDYPFDRLRQTLVEVGF